MPSKKSPKYKSTPSATADSQMGLSHVITRPDPVADPLQSVELGRVRVTVLTDRLFRIEYASDQQFEDRPTLAVVNRRFARTRFRHKMTNTGSTRSLCVETDHVSLQITDVDKPFSAKRLTARNRKNDGRWHFNKADPKNLGGTVRTLDNWDGNKVSHYAGWDDHSGIQLEWDEQNLGTGLLSRGGWTVFDDTGTVVLDPTAGRISGGRSGRPRPWLTQREAGGRHDLYLFAYGDDYQGALKASAQLFGPQPLPPRFAFGYWYSRYFPYTDDELLELTAELNQFGVPADVLVIDMDWHKLGWTGYSWDRDLFRDPTATLAAIHDKGLRVCLNLHPADGVGSHEDAFVEMCEAMGLDPAETDRIPFDATDPRFVDAYLRLLHHPEEDRGVDFWWMDWQQGTETPITGLDPLAWLNHLHWEDAASRRPGHRPLSFSRFDGVGAGRHPVGFSGDTYATWESLKFQPEFTATAANVLYGYWSHDIGGHFGGAPDPELYARWLQFGAHSPVLRTHGTLDPLAERKVWEFASPYRGIMIDAIRRRYELVPYIYGECRRGLDTGQSLVRPMYHDHPSVKAAYRVPGQYSFGSDMIVAPATSPVEGDSMAGVRVWLPQGEWFDTAHGSMIHMDSPDGGTVDRRYLLSEVPAFVRAGSVIPTQDQVNRLHSTCYPNLVLTVYPGRRGSHELYEDDGTSQGYLTGRSATTGIEHRSTGTSRTLRIRPTEGNYRGWKRLRDINIRFPNELPPREVLLDGAVIPWSPTPRPGHWNYNSLEATLHVTLRDVDLKRGAEVVLRRARSAGGTSSEDGLDGLVGLTRRLRLVDGQVRTLLGDDNRRIVAMLRSVEQCDADPSLLSDRVVGMRNEWVGMIDVLIRHADGQRSIEAIKPLEVPVNSELLDSMASVLRTAKHQFGTG